MRVRCDWTLYEPVHRPTQQTVSGPLIRLQTYLLNISYQVHKAGRESLRNWSSLRNLYVVFALSMSARVPEGGRRQQFVIWYPATCYQSQPAGKEAENINPSFGILHLSLPLFKPKQYVKFYNNGGIFRWTQKISVHSTVQYSTVQYST